MRYSSVGLMAAAAIASMFQRSDSVSYELRALDDFEPMFPRRSARNVSARSYRTGTSRYMPHIGAKERARHAGKPDGVMHGLPPLFAA